MLQAGGATAPTIAPFYGNLPAVSASSGDSFLLVRQSDCSLGYGVFNVTGSATGPMTTVTSTAANYEKVIHNNAFLTTTPDLYPHGCAAAVQGQASAELAYLGQTKSGGDYLGAAINGSSILTYSVNSSYATTVGTSLTTDLPPYSMLGGDLNNDGNVDLISANTDGLNSSVSVFISNGDGTYKPAVNYELPAR